MKKGLTLTLLLIPILTIVALTVFYINSSSTIVYPGLAKEKEKALSEEKKKLMMSAGVEGTPKIEFYSTAE